MEGAEDGAATAAASELAADATALGSFCAEMAALPAPVAGRLAPLALVGTAVVALIGEGAGGDEPVLLQEPTGPGSEGYVALRAIVSALASFSDDPKGNTFQCDSIRSAHLMLSSG